MLERRHAASVNSLEERLKTWEDADEVDGLQVVFFGCSIACELKTTRAPGTALVYGS